MKEAALLRYVRLQRFRRLVYAYLDHKICTHRCR